jgi:hypothetical protein
LLSALVDGELDHSTRDRVLVHLAHCAKCRADAEAERQVKALLSGLADPTPPPRLGASLLAIPDAGIADAGQAWPDPGEGVHGVPSGAFGFGRPFGQPGSRRAGPPGAVVSTGRRRRRRATVGLLGAAALAGMAVASAFAAGSQPGDNAEVTVEPPERRYIVEHPGTQARLPFTDPGAVTTVFGRGVLDTYTRR